MEKIEDEKNGGQIISVMIESLPAPCYVQWRIRSKDGGNFTPIDMNAEEFEGTTDSFPRPVLVVRQRNQLEKYCFQIEVTNFIGTTLQEISSKKVKRTRQVKKKTKKLVGIFFLHKTHVSLSLICCYMMQI